MIATEATKHEKGTWHGSLSTALFLVKAAFLCEERIVHINSLCSEVDLLHHSAAVLYFLSLFP